MAPITINGNTIDPNHVPEAFFPPDATDTNFILLQCHEKLELEQFEQLAQLHVHIQTVIGEKSYLCKYEPSDLSVLQELPYVDHAVTYHSDFVQDPSFVANAVAAESSPDMLAATILLHDDTRESGEDLLQEIQKFAPVEVIDHSDSQLRVYLQQQHIGRIAKIDCVRAIEPTRTIAWRDSKAMRILTRPTPFAFMAYQGLNQVIFVADSGFDYGDTQNVHPAFAGRVLQLEDHRVDKQKAIAAFETEKKKAEAGHVQVIGTSLRDELGHGTHVAGCALGDWDSAPAMEDIFQTHSVRSPAPKAKLVFQHIGATGLLWPDLNKLFTTSERGLFGVPVQIHTNSYGIPSSNVQKPYTQAESYKIDQAMYADPGLLIIWAAGNDGEEWCHTEKAGQPHGELHYHQISAEAAAKNALVVGATWNTRKMGEHPKAKGKGIPDPYTCLDDADKPPYDKGIDAPMSEVLNMSSKGPTVEGRLKPDVMAPGGGILSARSRAMSQSSKNSEEILFQPRNKDLRFMTGTSQAAPFVAGCAAAIREALIEHKISPNPTGALIKALIINGATDLQGSSIWVKNFGISPPEYYTKYNMPKSPNPGQGFGLVNLENSLSFKNPSAGTAGAGTADAGTVRVGTARAGTAGALELSFPQQGQTVTREVAVPTNVVNLSATMAYTDRPGALLQDFLQFKLFHSNGAGGLETKCEPDDVQYMPYMYELGHLVVKDNHATDNDNTMYTQNNVQRITLHNFDPKTVKKIKFTVFGSSVLSQVPEVRTFALCWTFSGK